MVNKFKRVGISVLTGITALSALAPHAVFAAPAGKKLIAPQAMPVQRKRAVCRYQDDTLLIMPNLSSDKQEIADALKEVHGTVIGTVGSGRLLTLIVRSEKGKLAEMEKKLAGDKHFNGMSRNLVAMPEFTPNDPGLVNQWHLNAVGASAAWDVSRGGGLRIAILDSGSQASVDELRGKCDSGFNAVALAPKKLPNFGEFVPPPPPPNPNGNTDWHGHGTVVASTAAATCNNNVQGSGIAPDARIYPINIAYQNPSKEEGKATTDDVAIMAAITKAEEQGIKIINISYGAQPPYHFTNAQLHAPLHEFFKDFHYRHGGLIFLSSGNDTTRDDSPRVDYLQVVTAVDANFKLSDFSNFGSSTTFAAPGSGIICTDRDGNLKNVSGTSFAAPICAGIAALVWSSNPNLSNTRVREIIQTSAMNSGSGWNQFFGFGMPNAARAVQLATGR